MTDAEKEDRETASSYRSWAAEMAPVVMRILEGKQEMPIYSSTEAWLAYLLCINESSVTRKELIEKAKSLDIPVPPEVEIDWAFEHLRERGWLQISFAIEDARKDGWNGEFVCRMRTGVKRRLAGIMGNLSVFRDAQHKLNYWLSVHPPDSASEETILAYALYLNESHISLAKVLEEMDAINIGIPNPHLLGAAFLRLRRRGWLVFEGENVYGLTLEARQFMDTLVTRRAYMEGPDEHLSEWMEKNPPPGYEPDPIGDSFDEDIEEMMGVLQTKGLLKPAEKGKRNGV